LKLTPKQTEVLETSGHLLVTGGPGSGKTTISILKAAEVAVAARPGQEVLFLSFARATISRVMEAIENEHDIPRHVRARITVETYHSFFWRILQTHGYLLGLPRKLSILTPANDAVALSAIRSEYKAANKLTVEEKAEKKEREIKERRRLAKEDGRVCFDLFSSLVAELLSRSERLRKLVATRYPFIVLDEFQDTNADQWAVVQQLGRASTLLALADPEQRIFDWIGADPERLNQFLRVFSAKEIPLAKDNHRSAGTDILLFGNEVLSGKFTRKAGGYTGIDLKSYPANGNEAGVALITTTYAARKRLVASKKADWSLAVLVPTKKMTRYVSDLFRQPPAKFAPISHTAAIELDAAILAAEVVSYLLQPTTLFHLDGFVDLLCNFYQGKGGDAPAKGDLQEADNIRKAFAESAQRKSAGKALRSRSIVVELLQAYEQSQAVALSGDPDADWLAIRQVLEASPCPRCKEIARDVRNIRLLERGTQLRHELSEDWRTFGCYRNALEITRQAFVREHFSTQASPPSGVFVMNMHKAKGKQFDEVIIFDGWPRYFKKQIVGNPDRIIRGNAKDNLDEQARQNLRVSITRGKLRTTILTPDADPCVAFIS
jgi:DNA helicase-2/ATP-dependent DNA helicase PcrA